jgi:rhodanese-related sulfurtransferase
VSTSAPSERPAGFEPGAFAASNAAAPEALSRCGAVRRRGMLAMSSLSSLRAWGALCAAATALPAWAFRSPPQWPQLKARIRAEFPQVPQMPVATLAARLADLQRVQPMLLDVRAAEEFDDGHLAGAHRVESFAPAMQRLRTRGPGIEAVLYCSVGLRSSKLAAALIDAGVPHLHNLDGSLFEWANLGHPVVSRAGRVDKVHPYDSYWGKLLRPELWSRNP